MLVSPAAAELSYDGSKFVLMDWPAFLDPLIKNRDDTNGRHAQWADS